MESVEVELFTDSGNNAVVRMPGRKFPGVLVQGDTLSTLWSSAAKALDQLRKREEQAEGLSELQHLVGHLDTLRTRYEGTLDAHGIRRPYNLPNR